MPRKRKHPPKPRDIRITPTMRELFAGMQAFEPYSEDWLKEEAELSKVLNCRAWEFPCVIHPDENCPYPPNTGAARWWPAAQARYRTLDAA
jgi:hypothetical protein